MKDITFCDDCIRNKNDGVCLFCKNKDVSMSQQKELGFISVIDMTDKSDDEYRRTSSLLETSDNCLEVVGGLHHSKTITFNKENAQKMINFCQKIIDKE
jgi:hypothetical protein